MIMNSLLRVNLLDSLRSIEAEYVTVKNAVESNQTLQDIMIYINGIHSECEYFKRQLQKELDRIKDQEVAQARKEYLEEGD